LNDGCDDFVLISASHGTVRVTQKAQAIELEAGEMCLTEMNVIGEADLSSVGAFTTTRFSRRTLLQVSPNAENYLARPLGHGDGPTQLFNRYFVLCNELAGELDEGARQAAAQHLTDLAGLVVSAGAEKKDLARQRGFSQARLDLLKSDIVAMLGKHDLSIEAVAKVSGLGERQVQRLFAQDETTFSDFVLQQRLLMARRLLLQNPQRKISDIAFAAGFNDLSYFNRAFRRFFGATPSDVRALGTAE
jgi:AraC-like DNA-binding protein